MKLAPEKIHFETIGDALEEADFIINPSGKAFRMLIDGMYSDKVGAPVREISSNASDSHIVAGNTQPFFVHAPTEIRPEFFVRDYGTGMDHHKVMTLYRTLFESDKDETNDLTGAFGLGKATPLAYSDQFSLSCYDGETVRHYGCGITASGRPRVVLMGTEPNDEPRGVRVTVAVEQKDFAAFATAIHNASLAHVTPTFESNIPLTNSRGEIAFEGEGWAAYTKSSLPQQWSVRQGSVIYPIKHPVNVPSDSGDRKWLIEAEIGQIAVIGSRESIQYTPQVVDYLNGRINALKEEVKTQVWDQVKDIESLVEFFTTYEKIKPNWMTGEVIHPFTGLNSTHIRLKSNAQQFHAAFETSRSRWVFKQASTIDAKTWKPVTEVYWIEDYEGLLDATRDKVSLNEFSKSELRRVSRLTRAFLEKKGRNNAFFMFGEGFSDDVWSAVFTDVKRVKISYDDLRDAAPKRLQPVLSEDSLPPIRGLGLALKAGDQSPVTQVSGDLADAAWIESDHYRKRPSDVFAFAKRFGITRLYLSSPTAVPIVTQAGVLHLREAIDAHAREMGLTWADLQHFKGNMATSSGLGPMTAKLQAKAPELYDKLERTKSPVGAMAKALRPMHAGGFSTFSEPEKKVMDLLDTPLNEHYVKLPPKTERFKAWDKAHDTIKNAYQHPLTRFINGLEYIDNTDALIASVECLMTVAKMVPITMKFK
ncbi:histidine kinase [Bajunvirus bajun]|uniref:Histidine kinase n=1 Tax=Brevundimonas phage vB_BgoS-Bajun TaxID=2948594 RepID=A0A9E7N7D2_9CAUD|nr:histidine kinase [Brevundimonas phage vB_BgoS-Bajun]